ncbi:hypothetical protein [Pseudoalteromonas spongiae]|uniref:hypothetical protein n=1 Tax=Pseudoalteromonas spongiae TaxID=298657 RepID=UPI00026CDA4D|nr:hypothetical protein [Pseudoalteromonas spongiae]ATD00435.1 hypothetical protein PSPO_b0393 [Pseudoalteromonas spongiae UST010723-006]
MTDRSSLFTPIKVQQFSLLIYALLALLMIATRPYHFASALHLPSASTAIFFILGLLASKHRTFAVFVVLSVSIDLTSSYYRGDFGDCITRSYPFLFVGYYVLWWAGHKSLQLKLDETKFAVAAKTAMALVNLWLASSIAFLTSNASYYWLSGKFSDMSLSTYSERVAQYYAPYVTSPFGYVAIALALYLACYYLKPHTSILKTTHHGR